MGNDSIIDAARQNVSDPCAVYSVESSARA